MRWQNPWAWIGLLSLALPILVHLFSRRPARVEPFPSLRFLDVSRLLPTRRTQLSDLPLLLVRLAILAAAVAALAQPRWRTTALVSDASVARAIVVDTMSAAGDPVATAALEREVARLAGGTRTSLRIATGHPQAVLAGAVAWLRAQRGRSELVVLSDFRGGTLDSLDVAGLPSDILVRLLRAPAVTVRADSARSPLRDGAAVRWANGAPPAIPGAVLQAVRGRGGAVFDDMSMAAPTDSTSRVIVVTSPGADSLPSWSKSARPLSRPWMGDVLYALRGDSALVSAAMSSVVTDTTLSTPFVVIARAANQAPVVAAAAIDGVNGQSRLLVWSRAPADALATAALLLSASKAPAPVMTREASAGANDTAAGDEQLQRWERAPEGVPRVADSDAQLDVESGPSDARFLWLAVLVLLGIETLMRRRAPRVTSESAPSATADG